MRKLGKELALSDREGDTLIKQRLVTEGRFLDPADPKDAELIAEIKTRRGEKHDEMTAREEERDAEKEVNLEKKDEDEAKEKADIQTDPDPEADPQPEGGDDIVDGLDEVEVTTEDEKEKPVTKRKGLIG